MITCGAEYCYWAGDFAAMESPVPVSRQERIG